MALTGLKSGHSSVSVRMIFRRSYFSKVTVHTHAIVSANTAMRRCEEALHDVCCCTPLIAKQTDRNPAIAVAKPGRWMTGHSVISLSSQLTAMMLPLRAVASHHQ